MTILATIRQTEAFIKRVPWGASRRSLPPPWSAIDATMPYAERGSRARRGRVGIVCKDRWRLPADGRRVVQQKVAWSTRCIVRVSNLSRRWPRGPCTGSSAASGAGSLAMFAVGEKPLVVGPTTLPADAAWTTANRSIAVVAMAIVVQTASAGQQGTD